MVINLATLVNRAVILEIKISALGLVKPIVEELIVAADRVENSVVINNTFF